MQSQVHQPSGANMQINLGVLGCGKHSLQAHVNHMHESDDVRIAAILDPSPLARAATERVTGLPVSNFTDEEALLLSPVDAVLIMSPDEFHAESLSRAVRAGKHVFVEKPLATNWSQLQVVKEALRLANERGLIVSSCHPRRFDPPFVWIKSHLGALIDELGPVLQFEFDFSYHRPTKEWKHNRGLLLDHVNHEIDLLNWYFGHASFEARRVIDTSDQYSVNGHRADGIQFLFGGTRRLDAHVYREFTKIRFTRGTLELDTCDGVISIHNHEDGRRRSVQVGSTDYELRFRLTNQNFIAAIKGEAPNYLTLQDLRVNTELSVALTECGYFRYELDE